MTAKQLRDGRALHYDGGGPGEELLCMQGRDRLETTGRYLVKRTALSSGSLGRRKGEAINGNPNLPAHE